MVQRYGLSMKFEVIT